MAIFGDIRFGLRSLAKTPTSTLTAVAALSLGLGANAVVFSIAYGALFRPLPFVSERVMYLREKDVQSGLVFGVSAADYRDWGGRVKAFESLNAFVSDTANVSDPDRAPEGFGFTRVTPHTFPMLGQKPVLGRDFTEDDAKPGAALVAILGDRVWKNRYGANRAILGQTIRLNGQPATVIGVMRPGFIFPYDTDLWAPLAIPADFATKRADRALMVVGMLKDGSTEASAAAEMAVLANNLAQSYPEQNRNIRAIVRSWPEENNDDDEYTILAALMGSVIFVLLIACANVANLLLARSADRTREISVRVALGAGRWRIIRQLLVESVILSCASGLLGWGMAIWGLRAFTASIRDQLPPEGFDFTMDYHALSYLALVSVGTGLLFGLAPAWKLAALNVNASLREGGRGSAGSRRTRHFSSALVVAEMALALVLLSGAGLMIRSVHNLHTTDPGVNPKNVLVMRLMLPMTKYPKAEDWTAFHDRMKPRLDSLPGVEITTIASNMPTGGGMNFPYELEGQPSAPDKIPTVDAITIAPDYFRAMDVRLARGRPFTETDTATSPQVAIVNQILAEKFWPGQEALGRRLRLKAEKGMGDWITVVGVTPNILQFGIAGRQRDPVLYLPFRQSAAPDMALMARTRVRPETLAAAFRDEVRNVDPDLPLYDVRTLEQRLASNDWEHAIVAKLLGIFAGIALALAAVGLYAVIAHSVNQRTQEIGVRMALGASSGDIVRGVFKQGMLPLGIGLAIGVAAAIGVTRFLSSLLVMVTATDPLTFVFVALVLGVAAALGCWIPARRAVRVDPAIALRYE